MQNKIAIYYHVGAYGTFIEWCLNYFSNNLFNVELPFTELGNAHKFSRDTVIVSEKMFQTALLENKKLIRLHPGTTSKKSYKLLQTPKQPINCYRRELALLEKHFDKIIVLYFNENNILWSSNNIVKCFVDKDEVDHDSLRQREARNYEGIFSKNLVEYLIFKLKKTTKNLVTKWNKDSIKNMKTWELREFLSFYLHNEWLDLHSGLATLNKEFPNVIFVEIGQLRDNFKETLIELFEKLNLKFNERDIEFVYQNWNKVQYFKNKDKEIKTVVHSIINNNEFSWDKLSIIDEAEIQRQLRNNNVELKCFDLNEFPTSAQEFQSLLIKNA